MGIIREHINKKNNKKICFVLMGILLIFSGCLYQRERQEKRMLEMTDTVKFKTDMSVVSMDGEFYEIIADNPIDKAFATKEASSAKRIQMAVARRDQWTVEIEHTLDILKEFLSEEDYQSLILAYKAWEKYLQNTVAVEQKLFYVGGQL